MFSYLIYAYLGLKQRSGQFGLLRAMGLSSTQLLVVVTMEQMILVGVAIMLGTMLGGGTGWLFTRFLQLSIVARESIPPFLIEFPWEVIARLYVVLGLIAAITLVVSGYFLRKLRVYASLRMEEG